MELLNSEKLKEHFKKNINELVLIKHDSNTIKKNNDKKLQFVPSYLIPSDYRANHGLKNGGKINIDPNIDGLASTIPPYISKKQTKKKHKKRLQDPLNTFKINRKHHSKCV